MIYRIFAFFIGRITFELERSERLLSAIVRSDDSFGKITHCGDKLKIELLFPSRKRFLEVASAADARILSETRSGLPFILLRFRGRIGVLLGIPIFFFLIIYPSLFIWEINVSGSSATSTETILAALAKEGLSVGCRIHDIDVAETSTRALLECDGLSWMAINISGTTAEVVVRDAVTPNADSSDKTPSNLIATCDGVIERIELISGQAVVSTGQTVRGGQVLISGFYEGRDGLTYTLEPSVGRVYARVRKVIDESVPTFGSKLMPTGRATSYRSFYFFGKEIALPGDVSDPYENSRKSSDADRLAFFGHPLPIGINTMTFSEVIEGEFTLDDDEATKLCEKKITKALSAALADAETLEITKSVSCDGAVCKIRVEVYCIENIAKGVPISTAREKQNK